MRTSSEVCPGGSLYAMLNPSGSSVGCTSHGTFQLCAEFGHLSIWDPVSANLGPRFGARFGRCRIRADFRQILPMPAHVWPISTRFRLITKCGPNSAECGHREFGRPLWPKSAKFGPTFTQVRRNRPNLGRSRPIWAMAWCAPAANSKLLAKGVALAHHLHGIRDERRTDS